MTPELEITPGARALYESWYLNLEQSIHTKRLDTYALKFLILLAVNASKSEVDEAIAQDAIDLMNWQLQARRLHDPIDADSAVAKAEKKIRRILTTGPRADRDLKRAVHYNRHKRHGPQKRHPLRQRHGRTRHEPFLTGRLRPYGHDGATL